MSILSATNLQFSKKFTDPAYPSIEYTYSLLNNKKEYQIASIMEDPNTIAYTPITATTPTTTFNALTNANQTTVGSGIVAYTTTGSLTTTGATDLMSNLYTIYNSSNLNNNTTSASKVATLITG